MSEKKIVGSLFENIGESKTACLIATGSLHPKRGLPLGFWGQLLCC
jgi:hypothetical protein